MLTKRRRQRKQQKKSHLCTCRTLFFVHFFAVVLHDDNVKLPETFFAADHFYLGAAGISHFLTAAIKFLCYSSNKIGLLCFLSLALALSLLSTATQKERMQYYINSTVPPINKPSDPQARKAAEKTGCWGPWQD